MVSWFVFRATARIPNLGTLLLSETRQTAEDFGLAKAPPEHATLSNTRRRLGLEAHGAVFGWVLERLRESGLLRGRTVGVNSTTLEANATMRAVVRRDDGMEYGAWLGGKPGRTSAP